VDVVTEVELIGWQRDVADEEVLLFEIQPIIHDAGHIVAYDNHEYYGTQIAGRSPDTTIPQNR